MELLFSTNPFHTWLVFGNNNWNKPFVLEFTISFCCAEIYYFVGFLKCIFLIISLHKHRI